MIALVSEEVAYLCIHETAWHRIPLQRAGNATWYCVVFACSGAGGSICVAGKHAPADSNVFLAGRSNALCRQQKTNSAAQRLQIHAGEGDVLPLGKHPYLGSYLRPQIRGTLTVVFPKCPCFWLCCPFQVKLAHNESHGICCSLSRGFLRRCFSLSF